MKSKRNRRKIDMRVEIKLNSYISNKISIIHNVILCRNSQQVYSNRAISKCFHYFFIQVVRIYPLEKNVAVAKRPLFQSKSRLTISTTTFTVLSRSSVLPCSLVLINGSLRKYEYEISHDRLDVKCCGLFFCSSIP
jgi:hypothetical protein